MFYKKIINKENEEIEENIIINKDKEYLKSNSIDDDKIKNKNFISNKYIKINKNINFESESNNLLKRNKILNIKTISNSSNNINKNDKINNKESFMININDKNTSNITKKENEFYLEVIKKACHIMKYLIIFILISNFYSINSQNIILYSYEIKLKVKDTGRKNILSASYECTNNPNVYLDNELVENLPDFHYINIVELYSEIKIEWNNCVITSTKNMFYNCPDIIEIDMTNFDTSSVTDMSNMFSSCSSLQSINVPNLNTIKVQTMENMFSNCISLTSINLESFEILSITNLSRMFYGCKSLEYINIKNFGKKQIKNKDEMFYNIPSNVVICLLSCSCPSPTNFVISDIAGNQVTISWDVHEWNDFTISYGSNDLLNPEEGLMINVNNQKYYEFTNLNSGVKYDV